MEIIIVHNDEFTFLKHILNIHGQSWFDYNLMNSKENQKNIM